MGQELRLTYRIWNRSGAFWMCFVPGLYESFDDEDTSWVELFLSYLGVTKRFLPFCFEGKWVMLEDDPAYSLCCRRWWRCFALGDWRSAPCAKFYPGSPGDFWGDSLCYGAGGAFRVGLGFRVSDLAEQFASSPCDCRIFFSSGLLGHLARKQPAGLITPLTRKRALRQTSENQSIKSSKLKLVDMAELVHWLFWIALFLNVVSYQQLLLSLLNWLPFFENNLRF